MINGLHYDFIIFDELKRGDKMFEVKKGETTIAVTKTYPIIKVNFERLIDVSDEHLCFTGEGQAKCDKGDKFDSRFGIELARIRSEIDMLKAYEEYLIKLTKQPEWRKEKKNPYLKVEWTPGKVDKFNCWPPKFMTIEEHEKYHKGLRK